MSLSIVKRPYGYINGTTEYIGAYINGSSTITQTSHGLSTGDIIYITFSQATGFWYVNKLDANTFTVSEYSGASAYVFIGDNVFTYYKTQSYNWNAVHLPIIYKLSSNLWPTNSVDTARNVSSYANDNGYVKLTLSGAIKSDVTELEFVKVTYVGGDYAIYQILSWYSTSIVTINLPYVLGITFSSVQYYYNNYHARIRIYAGIDPSHQFASQKPMALITEQKMVPDSSGIITFNISEFIKQQIEIISNNLLLGTLPNNIDAWCAFYITYAEGYDYSQGGYTLLDYIGSYTDDSSTFTGFAVNADLPFKNIYSGAMSNYICGDISSLKFLTPSNYPEVTSNNYFDISFINQFSQGNRTPADTSILRMKREVYNNGTIANLYFDSINDNDYGIYRFSVSQSIYLEDRIDITLQLKQSSSLLASIHSWSNEGSGTAWTATVPTVTLNTTGEQSQYLITPFQGFNGINYSFIISASMSASNVSNFTLGFLDSSFNETGDIIFVTINSFTDQTKNVTLTKQAAYIYCRCQCANLGTPTTFSLTRFDLSENYVSVSETKTITVIPTCSKFTNYNICWLNNLGGFDWKVFQSSSDIGVNIEGTKTVNKNIFKDWPRSFGEGADTIKQETSRDSRQTITFRAENQTSDQIQDLFRLKTSPLVQIVNAENDRRTIIPDSSSFVYYKQREKLFNFEFTAEFTDNLPSQAQ